jgi:hypothetical protein
MLDLAERVVGTEFRGATQTGAYRFLAGLDGLRVGQIDFGVFDRWTEYEVEDADGPIIHESIEASSMKERSLSSIPQCGVKDCGCLERFP